MFAKFFVDRPIFATVLSIVIVIVGGVAYTQLPVAQYPEVVPPTISVTASYPGADAKTVAETVATPIEQEVNGVERMLYMSSKSTNDGQMTLDVTFELGTDLDTAQVLVQNRVSIALSKLPEDVRRIGVTTKKKSPSILLCVNIVSAKRPDGSYYYNQLHLSNFATLNIKDDLARIKGVGDVSFLGARDYSMRIWLDPNKLASLQLTASDVIKAVKEQNVQVAAGRLGQPLCRPARTSPFRCRFSRKGASAPKSNSRTSSSSVATTANWSIFATSSPPPSAIPRGMSSNAASNLAPATTRSTATSMASRPSRWPCFSCRAPTRWPRPKRSAPKWKSLRGAFLKRSRTATIDT